MWDRWRKGETIHQIAKLFDRGHSSIQRILAEAGGIEPPQRHRAAQALTLAEREEISRCLVARLSIRSIAARLGRAPSTISRRACKSWGGEFHQASLTYGMTARSDLSVGRRPPADVGPMHFP
jgi:transposase